MSENVCGHCGSPDEAPDPTCGACPPTDRVPCLVDSSCCHIAENDDALLDHLTVAHPGVRECEGCLNTTGENPCHECGTWRTERAVVAIEVHWEPVRGPQEDQPQSWNWTEIVGEPARVLDHTELRERYEQWRSARATVPAATQAPSDEEGLELLADLAELLWGTGDDTTTLTHEETTR